MFKPGILFPDWSAAELIFNHFWSFVQKTDGDFRPIFPVYFLAETQKNSAQRFSLCLQVSGGFTASLAQPSADYFAFCVLLRYQTGTELS